jgi:hypothetical protein
MKLGGLLVAFVLAGCGGGGGKARSAETPVVASEDGATGADGDAAAPAPDAACVAACLGKTPGAGARDGFAGYCDELCTPPTEPSQPCVMSCEKSHEPGGRYDEQGEYVEDEDTRDEAQKQADHEGCVEECRTVPVLSDEAMTACVDACTADGRPEGACKTACDPDPYDQCRYDPCD